MSNTDTKPLRRGVPVTIHNTTAQHELVTRLRSALRLARKVDLFDTPGVADILFEEPKADEIPNADVVDSHERLEILRDVVGGHMDHAEHAANVYEYMVKGEEDIRVLEIFEADNAMFCQECVEYSGRWLVELHPMDARTESLVREAGEIEAAFRSISAIGFEGFNQPSDLLSEQDRGDRIDRISRMVVDIRLLADKAEQSLAVVRETLGA